MTADAATGLDWMRVRAYDPSVGRFLSRDPLGRAPLFFADNPYVYAGNSPLSNVDPSGQYRAAGFGSKVHESWAATKQMMARVVTQSGKPTTAVTASIALVAAQMHTGAPTPPEIQAAQNDARRASDELGQYVNLIGSLVTGTTVLAYGLKSTLATGFAAVAALLGGIGLALEAESFAFAQEANQGANFWTNEALFSAASGAILAIGPVITLLVAAVWVALTALNAEEPGVVVVFAVGLMATIGAAVGAAADELVATQTIDQQSKDLGY